MPVFKVAIERTSVQSAQIEILADDESEAQAAARRIYLRHRASLIWSPAESLGVEYVVSPWQQDEEGNDVVEGQEVWF